MEFQGFLSSLYLSLSKPTTGTLELCFQRSANRTQGHLSLGSGQTKESFWAPALSSQSLIPGELAGVVSLELFHQHPLCTYCPCCHPCAEPRAASGEFSPWLGVSAEGVGGSWASAEWSTSETPHWKLLCFGLGWYRRSSVEAAVFPHYCKGRKEEILEKQGWGLMEMSPIYSLQQERKQPRSNPPVSEQMSSWSRIVHLSMGA